MESEKLDDQKKINNPLQMKKNKKKEKLQIKNSEKGIEIKLSSILQKLENIPNIKNKCETLKKFGKGGVRGSPPLTKHKHYYKSNEEILREKAKKKYKEKMKNRKYRFEYLARQRDYNRRRKKKDKYKCLKILNLLYPYNPFKDISPIQIIFLEKDKV